MAKYVDPNPVDKYNHTDIGGIEVDDSFNEYTDATAAYVEFTASDNSATLYLLRAGAQDLSTRKIAEKDLTKNGTGTWELSNDADVDAAVATSTHRGSGFDVVNGTNVHAELELNGDGDVRAYLYDGTGSTVDPTEDFRITTTLQAVSDTNDTVIS